MATTVKLTPTNLPQIVFGTGYQSAVPTGFYLLLDTLEFHESERREILYSETKFGGKAINFADKLTPLEFSCIVFGTTRNQMLERSEQLAQAVGNVKGGLFEYTPDGVTTTSFYTYEMSAKPSISSQKLNRWDDIARERGIFAMIFDVTLTTQPFVHSQVFTAVSPTISTIDNTGSNNAFDLSGIKGDVPALVQLKLTNTNAATLNRFYICSRSSVLSTLASLVSYFEAEDADTMVGSWTNQVDAARSGGEYQQLTCSPTVWGSLLFDLPSINDYEGLLTILPVVKASVTTIVCRIAVYLNDVLVWASPNQYSPETTGWEILYAGEFNFPPILISNDTNATLQLAVEFLGTGTVNVDFVQVFFSDESIAQIDISTDASYGVSYGQTLLFETDLKNIRKAIVLDSLDNVQYFARSIYGTLSLTCFRDTRFLALWQRMTGADLHIPADSMDLVTSVIYRSTYPFRD
jgi:hypothetical protein